MLTRVGILGHPLRPQTEPITEHIVSTFQSQGIQTWHFHQWDDEDVQPLIPESQMVVAIGGDGAMLRAARVCAPFGVPVLGVNMGRLGFLTEISNPDDWDDSLVTRLIREDYWTERRMMITASVRRNREILVQGDALNDVVISGTHAGTMVQLDAYIDGHWATTYHSDALIVATPTGSTAYALAAGGPILPPDLTNLLVLPSSPHLTMDRAIVLSEGSKVAVRPSEDNRLEVQVSIDGAQLAHLSKDDIIRVRACDHSAWFVRMRDRNYFYRSLLDRLEPRINRTAPHHMMTLDQIEDAP